MVLIYVLAIMLKIMMSSLIIVEIIKLEQQDREPINAKKIFDYILFMAVFLGAIWLPVKI